MDSDTALLPFTVTTTGHTVCDELADLRAAICSDPVTKPSTSPLYLLKSVKHATSDKIRGFLPSDVDACLCSIWVVALAQILPFVRVSVVALTHEKVFNLCFVDELL